MEGEVTLGVGGWLSPTSYFHIKEMPEQLKVLKMLVREQEHG